MDEGNAKRACKLVAAHLATEPAVIEAEFHAGWYALRGLDDTRTAERHFGRSWPASPRAQMTSHLLSARTAAGGRQGLTYFRQAAHFPATFYGQLAAARLSEVDHQCGLYRY